MWFLGFHLKTYIKDRGVQLELLEIEDADDRRQTLLSNLDNGGFQKLVVFVSGIGFAAGAYQIFAVGVTLPIIEMASYYPHSMSDADEGWLRIASLIGALIGMLGAGFLSDIYGRRKLYGFELLVLLVGTLITSTASRGDAQSMSLFSWLFAGRFIMGLGIGADYPLSAGIAAEFAPTRHRARMIASVFYFQLAGYFMAALVSIMALASYRDSIPHDIQNRGCDIHCRRALDRSWRTIIGVGAILAVIAVWFRRTIPESPRYTADILHQVDGAQEDMASFMTQSPLLPPESDPAISPGPATSPTSAPAQVANNIPVTPPMPEVDEETVQKFSYRARENLRSFKQHYGGKGFWRVLVANCIAWFTLDAAYYALVGASSTKIATKVWSTLPVTYGCTVAPNAALGSAMDCSGLDYSAKYLRPQSLWEAIFGNLWRVLILVCAGAIPAGLVMIWLVQKCSLRRLQIMGFTTLAVVFVVAGAILRNVPASETTRASLWLYIVAQIAFQIGPNFTTFILATELAPTRHRAFAHGISAASGKCGAIIFIIFFQFVKFPGGLYVDDPGTRWLGDALLCFMPFMVLGALITWAWVPETRDAEGRSRSLEDLENLKTKVRGSDGVFKKLVNKFGGSG